MSKVSVDMLWHFVEQAKLGDLDYALLSDITRMAYDPLRSQFHNYGDTFCFIAHDFMTHNHNHDPHLPYKDYIFESILELCDYLAPHKSAIAGLRTQLVTNPCAIKHILPAINLLSHPWAKSAPTHWPMGIKIQALNALIVSTINCWLDDDTPEISKTMAKLDQNLTHIKKTSLIFDVK